MTKKWVCGYWAAIPVFIIPVYATSIPYIDRYLLDELSNQYNWGFLVIATMFSAILAFLTDAKHQSEIASIKTELANTRQHANELEIELVNTKVELIATKQRVSILEASNVSLQTNVSNLLTTNSLIQAQLNTATN